MVLADLVAGTMAGFGICAVVSVESRARPAAAPFRAETAGCRHAALLRTARVECAPPHSICLRAQGHPFDTMKVLMQTNPSGYKGMGDAARQIVARKGLKGLYEGVASPLIGMGIFNAVQFAVFAASKRVITNDGKDVTLNRIAAAAGFTGIFVAFVEGPQDLFKSQMQSQMQAPAGTPLKYASTMDCCKTILRERGASGPFQGIGATIARNIVGVTMYFYVYEAARLGMAGDKPVSSLPPLAVMLAGGLGGVGYWTFCYPLDIIKTALQTDAINPAERKYKGQCRARGAWRRRRRTRTHALPPPSPRCP